MQEMALDIKVNDRTQTVQVPGGARFDDVMRAVGKLVLSPGAAITRVRLNGSDITGKDWDPYLSLNAAEIAGLEVETGNPITLAREMLESLQEFTGSLIGQLEKASELYRLGNQAAATELFARVLDGIQLVSHTTVMVERNLGVDVESLSIEGKPASEQLSRLEPILEDMFAAQRSSDWVLLADLIEYELVPYFQDRSRIVEMWAEKAGHAASN